MFYGLASCIARLLAGPVCNLTRINPMSMSLIGKFDQVFAQQMSITMLVMDFSHFQHNLAPVQHSPSQNRRFRLKSYNHLL